MVDNVSGAQQSANRAIATLKTRESEMESHEAELEVHIQSNRDQLEGFVDFLPSRILWILT